MECRLDESLIVVEAFTFYIVIYANLVADHRSSGSHSGMSSLAIARLAFWQPYRHAIGF